MNWFYRLISEREELDKKIFALSAFINMSDTYKTLSTKQKRLLCMQREFMQAYLLVLTMRIEDIQSDDTQKCI